MSFVPALTLRVRDILSFSIDLKRSPWVYGAAVAMIPRKDRTITRQNLADAVCRASGLPRSEASDLVAQVFGVISETLVFAEPVLLSGFGKFHVVDRAPRRARNVRAGHEVTIGARKALVFKPAIGLVERLSVAGAVVVHVEASQPRADFV